MTRRCRGCRARRARRSARCTSGRSSVRLVPLRVAHAVRDRHAELAEQAREDRHGEDGEHERAAAGRGEEASLEHDEQERERGREPAEEEDLDRRSSRTSSPPGTSGARTSSGFTGGVALVAAASFDVASIAGTAPAGRGLACALQRATQPCCNHSIAPRNSTRGSLWAAETILDSVAANAEQRAPAAASLERLRLALLVALRFAIAASLRSLLATAAPTGRHGHDGDRDRDRLQQPGRRGSKQAPDVLAPRRARRAVLARSLVRGRPVSSRSSTRSAATTARPRRAAERRRRAFPAGSAAGDRRRQRQLVRATRATYLRAGSREVEARPEVALGGR